MLPRNRRAFAVLALIVATILAPELRAQWHEPPATSDQPAPRFDVAPTLAALAKMRDTAEADRAVASTAWTVLALLANGSTMRTGPHKEPIRVLVLGLRTAQDETGRFVRLGVPCVRGDQFVAALAMNETYVASNYTLLKPLSVRGIGALDAAMFGPAATPATVEEFVCSVLLARSAAIARSDTGTTGLSDKILRHARSTMVAGKVRRTDAALHLDDLLQGSKHPLELTVARTWPANLTADPLHTLIGALALTMSNMEAKALAAQGFTVPDMEAKALAAQWKTLDQLVAARETAGKHAGTWAPAGGFDRIATTAMHAITLALANGTPGLPLAK